MTANESLSLLACQISIPEMTTVAERDIHLANTCEKVANAMAGEQVDLVVLLELSSIEYSRTTFECIDALAEPLDGPSFQCWRRIAIEHACHVSYSFAREENSQFLRLWKIFHKRNNYSFLGDRLPSNSDKRVSGLGKDLAKGT